MRAARKYSTVTAVQSRVHRRSYVRPSRFHKRHRPGSRASTPKDFSTPLELARGIISVVGANMERALRLISVERGHDPRDFALICFGGAGGLHAADLARALGMARVIVPQNPGGFSALGALLSDIVKDVSQSVLLPVPATARPPEPAGGRHSDFVNDLERRFKNLEQAGRATLRTEGFQAERARCERRLDVRYAGQAYELPIPFRARFTDVFHREHERAYGHAQPGRALEVVNLRVRLTIPTPKPRLGTENSKLGAGNWRMETQKLPAAAILKRKAVWFEGRWRTTPVFSRDRLPPGVRFWGPAVVVEYSSTTVVPPDFACAVDEYLNLVLAG